MPIVDPYRLKAQRIKKVRGTAAYASSFRVSGLFVLGSAVVGYITWYFTFRDPAKQEKALKKFAGLQGMLSFNQDIDPFDVNIAPKAKLVEQWQQDVARREAELAEKKSV